MRNVVVWVLAALKVLLAILMILGGISTMLSPLDPTGSLLVNNRLTLVFFGLTFILSGLSLLLGKITRNRRMVGRSLMAIYLVTLFTVFLELLAVGTFVSVIDNIVITLWAAGLWLWWKHKTEWISGKEIAKYRIEARRLDP